MEDLSSLGPIDIGALAVIALCVITGFARGFIWQLLRLATLVGGFLLARVLEPEVAPRLEHAFPSLGESGSRVAAYFSVFFAVVLAGSLVAYLLRSALKALKLSAFDRLLGALLGALKGVAIVVVAVLVLTKLPVPESFQEQLARSEAARLSASVVDNMDVLFPPSVREDFAAWLKGLSGAGGADKK